MMSSYDAKITLDAQDKTQSIFDSINTDNESYPENPVKTKIILDRNLVISTESEHLPHLRASLNSTLRLIQASYESIESTRKHN